MKTMQPTWKPWLLSTVGGQVTILTVVMLPCFLIALMLAWLLQSGAVFGMVAVVAGICYVAAILAMAGEHWFAARQFALVGIFWAMAFRTGFPLAAAIILLVRGDPLDKPWIICYLGAFYIVALTVHVALSYYSIDEAQAATKLDNSLK